jgi:hypothetical protein
MLQVFIPNVSSVFHRYVASVFVCMLHMFHTYVDSVLFGCCISFLNGFSSVLGFFASVSDDISSASSIFRHMLQMFHLDVSKVDRVLHMLHGASGWPTAAYRNSSFLVRRASPSPLLSSSLLPLPSLSFPSLHLDTTVQAQQAQ